MNWFNSVWQTGLINLTLILEHFLSFLLTIQHFSVYLGESEIVFPWTANNSCSFRDCESCLASVASLIKSWYITCYECTSIVFWFPVFQMNCQINILINNIPRSIYVNEQYYNYQVSVFWIFIAERQQERHIIAILLLGKYR